MHDDGRRDLPDVLTVDNADGSGSVTISTDVCGNVRWSPDGTRLLYVACADGGASVVARSVAPDGSDDRAIGPAAPFTGNMVATWQPLPD